MTIGDKIRAMSDEELAKIIMCPYDEYNCYSDKNCIVCSMEWLRKPAEEDDHEN